jgi:hypothetical protein
VDGGRIRLPPPPRAIPSIFEEIIMNQSLRFPVSLLVVALFAGGAQAAQKTTSKCSVNGPGGNQVSVPVESGSVPLSDIAMTVNNTSGANKNAYIHLSADAGITPNAELRLTFSLDGAAGIYAGPQNLANHTDFYMTRNALAVLSIPPGSHTITPNVFVSGSAGNLGVVDDRCMFITF